MSNDYWDNSPEEEVFEDDGVSSANPFVFVNGAKVDVEMGSSFVSSVGDVAKNAGLGKFRVFLNGNEILPSESPEFIGESDSIELRKYDVAG